MARRNFFLLFLFMMASAVFATHNRSGEITYQWVSGLTYKIKVYTYTNPLSSAADRCTQTVYVDRHAGVNDSVLCLRTNGAFIKCVPENSRDGVVILSPNAQYDGVQENIYEGTYTFAGPGMHVFTMIDPNRNAGVINIPSSVNEAFAISDTIYIYNIIGLRANSSPVLTFKPIDQACVNQPFYHNPGALDPDGDSLSYRLVTPLGSSGNPISGYILYSTVTINPVTGILSWIVPGQQGEFNYAIEITEWRRIPGLSQPVIMGRMIRDLQVNVLVCQNQAPAINPVSDICVLAGTNITTTITATDPNSNDLLTLQATGLPLPPTTYVPPASFNSTPATGTVTGVFSWTPSCDAVKQQPYSISVKVTDSGSPINLVSFQVFQVKVVAPPPTNVTANPVGSSIVLNWIGPNCTQTTGNILVSYLVYRKENCDPFVPTVCQPGVPATAGFTLIGSTASNIFTFTDNNNGSGLTPGYDYSYLIVARFADGSESMASTQVCSRLKSDVPIILNVSVDTTDASVGKMFVRWSKPLIGPSNLDTVANPGPYTFNVSRRTGTSGSFSQVYSVTQPYFGSIINATDTSFIDVNLNTVANQYFYQIEMISNGNSLGFSQKASSIFLSVIPHDKTVDLSWNLNTPWSNSKYYIYKKQLSSNFYDLIDSTSNTFITVDSLVNGQQYCFKVLSKGAYSSPALPRPLLNWSQKVCATPVDDTPPCSPVVSVSGSCSTSVAQITWTNPNINCPLKDAIKYYLYYTPFIDSAMYIIDTITNINDTIYTTDYLPSLAGCYSVTAIDSAGNESPALGKFCVDNCPEYELPNILTFNGDNINDTLIPVRNKYIKDVEFVLYNRWGQVIFETTKPALLWDGRAQQSGQPVSAGVYYYVCKVNEIRYTGIKSYYLKGFIHIFR